MRLDSSFWFHNRIDGEVISRLRLLNLLKLFGLLLLDFELDLDILGGLLDGVRWHAELVLFHDEGDCLRLGGHLFDLEALLVGLRILR